MATTVTKDKICEAAMQLAIRDGLLAMTLDNVAKQAGISKGGVIYHFPSKDELVRGVLDYWRLMACFCGSSWDSLTATTR